GLDWPEHGGMLIGSGLQALTTLGKFKPAVLGEIQAAGDIERREEAEMSRFFQAWLALSFSAAAVLPAHAQVTVEMTKITCEQYILFAMGDPKDIAMWMTGYYSAKRNSTTFDVQEIPRVQQESDGLLPDQ